MKREVHYIFAILISIPVVIFLNLDPLNSFAFILISFLSSGIPDILERRRGKRHRATLHSKTICLLFLIIFFLLAKRNPLASSFFFGYASHILLDSLKGKTPWI